MPRPKREASEHPSERRGHGALKFNEKLAEQFGILPPGQDPPRETVKVAALPDPPGVNLSGAEPESSQALNVEETVLNMLKEEMQELAFRLANVGVTLTAPQQQEMVDHAFAVLGGFVGGGALARR